MQSTTRDMKGVIAYYDVCPYCGKRLKHVDVNLFGKTYSVGCWASCGCEDALADDAGVTDQTKPYFMAGIPDRYLDAACDMGGNERDVLDGRSLYITGPNGAGKTYYACSVARCAVDNGRTVYFTSSVALIQAIRETYDGIRNGVLDRAYGCDVLVLDDLGKENPTRNALEVLFMLVDQRYADRKPTVITSNFSRGELADRWDSVDASVSASIVSRLCEDSNLVVLNGRDRRLA